ncbi:DUF4347 domain-containing protein [Microcoleus sp. FACHB-1515]|uniref:DUF4347 domain-containing protein n=1 Tax=Cyanophyceae TaxID=3028117 RepID=UPI0016889B31|nr:DUF4347 domain-containing protein [Microcoleus sp. FACHB-1515]MBD2088625.1 DUF4347 domain-containing protein [Microcoleus sp. FACHB-1515]
MTTTSAAAIHSIAFVDAAVADSHLMLGATPGVEVILLDSTQDGIAQITSVLQGRSNVESVQIFAHGASGSLRLGTAQLNTESLESYASQLEQWRSAFSETGDLLLFGCDVAADGTELIDRLSQLTGTDVAASTNLTGNAPGADWNLEAQIGTVTAQKALQTDSFQGVLADITVTNTNDSGAGSLRAAIAQARSGDTIRFASSLQGRTITLTSGEISIPVGKNLTIDGSGASGLTISGNNSSRIFLLNSTSVQPTTLNVRNLTLANGKTSDRGGAISTTHQGVLNIENVTFNNNVADQGGGAIFSAFEGTVTVTNSRFNANKATAGNDERGAGAIAFWGPRSLTVRNSDFTNNEGINGGAINSLNGKLTIENSRFINNNTLAARFASGQPNDFLRGYGGAVYADRASSLEEASGSIRITGSTFQGNKGKREGGAAYLFTGRQDRVDISRSQFTENTVQPLEGVNQGNGGGLVVMSNEVNRGLTIDRSSFANNTATLQGGGLWMMNAPTTITNSTFSGNRTTSQDFSSVGGGMALYGQTTILNTTIANNRAGWVGGGVSASDGANVTAKNTIFANNTADNGGNDWKIRQQTSRELTNGGGNIQFPGLLSNQFNRFNDNTATANIRIIDPKLGALQNNGSGLLTHALLAGSPAIDAGVSGAPTVDAFGQTRDAKPDIGAVEFRTSTSGGGSSGGGSGGSSGGGSTPGGSTNQTLTGTDANNVLQGADGRDRLIGNGGDDVLIGHGNADRLTGSVGADLFVYSGASMSSALAGSRLANLDRITDFRFAQGDRFQLDYDGDRSTREQPSGLFNAGRVQGSSLTAAARSAYRDKNQRAKGSQALNANEAVFFTWQNKTYLSVNNGTKGFSVDRDLMADVTGIRMRNGDASAGVLNTNNYFA